MCVWGRVSSSGMVPYTLLMSGASESWELGAVLSPLCTWHINPVLYLLRGEVLGGVALELNIDTNHIELISYKVK